MAAVSSKMYTGVVIVSGTSVINGDSQGSLTVTVNEKSALVMATAPADSTLTVIVCTPAVPDYEYALSVVWITKFPPDVPSSVHDITALTSGEIVVT